MRLKDSVPVATGPATSVEGAGGVAVAISCAAPGVVTGAVDVTGPVDSAGAAVATGS